MVKQQPIKGTCWYVDLGETPEHGDVLYKTRPCVIVSDNQYNRLSECLTIVPIVSKTKKTRKTHAAITLHRANGIAKAEQMRTISKNQLRGFVGTVDQETMQRISKSIAYHLFADDLHKEDGKVLVSL